MTFAVLAFYVVVDLFIYLFIYLFIICVYTYSKYFKLILAIFHQFYPYFSMS